MNLGGIKMLKGKLRNILIGTGLCAITFVGTAMTYYSKVFHDKGMITFKANNSTSLSVLFSMIFLIMGICIYLIIENRNLIKQNQQLLYKILSQNEVHYNELQKTNMNNREILFDAFNSDNNIA
jgi:hypothetical protein